MTTAHPEESSRAGSTSERVKAEGALARELKGIDPRGVTAALAFWAVATQATIEEAQSWREQLGVGQEAATPEFRAVQRTTADIISTMQSVCVEIPGYIDAREALRASIARFSTNFNLDGADLLLFLRNVAGRLSRPSSGGQSAGPTT